MPTAPMTSSPKGRTKNGKNGVGTVSDSSLATSSGVSASSASAAPSSRPTGDDIARRAFEIYEREGRQDGKDLENWLRAEAELLGER
jgi:hypothetical protein